MAGFIFDARAALSEIQDRTPATTATTATNPVSEPEKSQLSQLSQPSPGQIAVPPDEDLTEDQLDAFEERAAIMEFDGRMTREEAERRALEEVMG